MQHLFTLFLREFLYTYIAIKKQAEIITHQNGSNSATMRVPEHLSHKKPG
jgi:hypothetical protein